MKKNSKFKDLIPFIFSFSLYIIAGIITARFFSVPENGAPLLYVLVLAISVYASFLVHIVLHEAGHLVCGLISGYRFLFFRIYSLMLVKNEGKLRLKKFKIAGTAGQCIMLPPDGTAYEEIPFFLYNSGGVLSNLIFSAIFSLMYIAVPLPPMFNVVFPTLSVLGMVLAVTNGIPVAGSTVANDGYNILSMMRYRHARRAFAIQLEMNGMIAMGKSVSEMPEEWFTLLASDEMNDPLSAFVAVACVDRLMEERRFSEVLETIGYISDNAVGISGLSRALLECNRMYCEMINGASRDTVECLRTREQVSVMKQMKNFPVVIRTEYAYTMLCKDDRAGAIEMLKRFDRIAKTYPYPVDIECERALMLLADKQYYEMKGATNGKN